MSKGFGEFYSVVDDGLICVDGSGLPISNVTKGRFIYEEHMARIDTLSVFNKKINESSSRFLTVPSVLEEIRRNCRYYKNIVDKIKQSRNTGFKVWNKGRIRKFESKPFDRVNKDRVYFLAKKGKREYCRLCDFLEEGIYFYGLNEKITDLRQEKSFVDCFNDDVLTERNKLSFADKRFVGFALASEDRSGILSGDKGIVLTYDAGVNRFDLRERFVCNPMQDRSYFV